MSKTLYFTSAAAPTHRGNNDAKLNGTAAFWEARLMSESRGSVQSTLTCATVVGPTAGIEIASGGLPVEWLTEPLSADFTISATMSFNLWGFEATMNDNSAINVVIEKIDGATGALTTIVTTARTTELALTTATVNNFTATPTSTACKRGDRLRVRVFADDSAAATMAVGTTTFSYNGPTVSANGDSWIAFVEDLSFEQDIGTTGSDLSSSAFSVFGATGAVEMFAQPFTAKGDGTLTKVQTVLLKFGAPADNVVVEVRTDSAGVPSSTVVGTVATVAGGSISTSSAIFVWSGLSIALTPNTLYWLVIRRSGALNATVNYGIAGHSTGSLDGLFPYNFQAGAWGSPFTGYLNVTLLFANVGSTYYLTNTAETINPVAAIEKKALTTRGGSSVNSVTDTSTITPPTPGFQITDSGGGTSIEWYTPPLQAVTLGGKSKFNIRALESSAGVNASLKAEIAITSTDGVSSTVWGVANIEGLTAGGAIGELTTADSALEAWVAGDDTAITLGQRLRFRIFTDDCGNVVLGSGTVTVSYNGPTASAAGDTYVTLPVTVLEQVTSTPSDSPGLTTQRRTPRRRILQRL